MRVDLPRALLPALPKRGRLTRQCASHPREVTDYACQRVTFGYDSKTIPACGLALAGRSNPDDLEVSCVYSDEWKATEVKYPVGR